MITKDKIKKAVEEKKEVFGSWVAIVAKLNRVGTNKEDNLFYPEIFSKVSSGKMFYTFDQLQRIQTELRIKIFI